MMNFTHKCLTVNFYLNYNGCGEAAISVRQYPGFIPLKEKTPQSRMNFDNTSFGDKAATLVFFDNFPDHIRTLSISALHLRQKNRSDPIFLF